jgi:hypothetical protein
MTPAIVGLTEKGSIKTSGGGAAAGSPASLPVWAIRRVATVLDMEPRDPARRTDAVDLARRTGLSKSLARRCLRQLQGRKMPPRR